MSLGFVLFGGGGFGGLERMYEFYADRQFASTPGAAAGELQTATISVWWRWGIRGAINGFVSSGTSTTGMQLYIDSAGRINIVVVNASTTIVHLKSSATYLDQNIHNVVVQFDMSNATIGERCTMYVDSVEIETFDLETRTGTTAEEHHLFDSASEMFVGSVVGSDFFDGELGDVNLIQGQLIDPNALGTTIDSNWVWKNYSGTHGTNGARLRFNNSGNIAENSAAA